MTKKNLPTPEVLWRIRRAFLDQGYRKLTMGDVAQACGFTRRNLYFYFSSKEEVYRATIEFQNRDFAESAIVAGRTLLEKNVSPSEILSEIINVRYGTTRRELGESAHAQELNTEAFRLCKDIMQQTAISFAKSVAGIIGELEAAGRLKLRKEFTRAQVAQMLLDGARGINQNLPTVAASTLSRRYRMMCKAILYGATTCERKSKGGTTKT